MASNTVVVRVLGNTKSLSRSLNKARKDLQGLENINRNMGRSFRVAAIGAGVFGAAAVAAGALGAAALASMPAMLAGIGVAFAAQSEKVKSAWTETKDYVLKEGQRLAKPLEAVLVRGATQSKKAFDALAPSLEKVFKLSSDLVDDAFAGMVPLAEKLGPILEKGFKAGEPVLRALGSGLDYVLDGLDGMFDALTKNGGSKVFADFATAFMKALGGLLPVLGQVMRALTPLGTEIMEGLTPALEKFANYLEDEVVPKVEKFVEILKDNRDKVVKLAGALAGLFVAFKVITAFSTLASVIGLLASPIGLAVIAIGGIGFALYKAWNESETFREKVTAMRDKAVEVFNDLKEKLGPSIERIKTLAGNVWRDVKEWWARDGDKIMASVEKTWNSIKESIGPLMDDIVAKVEKGLDDMTKFWNEHGDAILSMVTTVFPKILGMIGDSVNIMTNLIQAGLKLSEGDFKGAFKHMKEVGKSWLGFQKKQGEALADLITKPWKDGKKDIEKSGLSEAGRREATKMIRGVGAQAKKLGPAIKGPAQDATKALKSAGQAMSSSMSSSMDKIVSSTRSGGNRVVGEAGTIPGRVKGALQSGGDYSSVGSQMMAGVVAGINAMRDEVAAAAASVASAGAAAARSALEIRSPSRVFRRIGQWTMKGLIKGFEDGRQGIRNTIGRISDRITKYFDKRFKNDKKAARFAKEAIKSLRNETRALNRNAAKRMRIYRKVERAETRLDNMRKNRRDYKGSVIDGLMDYASISNLESAFTPQAMAQQLRARINKIRQFNDTLNKLIKRGLNRDMVRQLAEAGVEGGLAHATAIASGGKKAVKQFNTLQKQLTGVTNQVGNRAADDMYKAGIRASAGLVKGLRKRRGALERTARRMGRVLVRAVKKALKINSPSRVFQRLGEQTVQGMEVGLKDIKGVRKATINMADAMTDSFKRPQLVADAHGGGGTGKTNTYNINITAPATVDKAAIGREVVAAIDAYERQGGRRRA